MFRASAVLMVVAFFLSACSVLGPARIQVSRPTVLEARISELEAGDLNFRCICDIETGDTTSPVFMTIRNRGGEADTLLRVESESAARVELRLREDEVDLSTAPVNAIVVPPLGKIDFTPGQYEMILTGLKQDLKPGETVRLSLVFDRTGPVVVEAVVTPAE